ncbi:hypothetical protein [Streptomyces venezuelae]|uniref:hypothetical protein n=1 Tax=Streptomyces venezuelae TaxID=54571 RepID=UPI00168198F4|nr:hypothetical protein [Streptomyces venezuelae]
MTGDGEGLCPRCGRNVTLLRTRRRGVVLDSHEAAPFSDARALRIRCPGTGRAAAKEG